MILGLFYPEYMAFFLFAVALDITSHYAHLYRYDALGLHLWGHFPSLLHVRACSELSSCLLVQVLIPLLGPAQRPLAWSQEPQGH